MSWMLPAALYCMLAILWETVDQMCLSPAQHLWKVQNQQQQFELPYYSKPITSFISRFLKGRTSQHQLFSWSREGFWSPVVHEDLFLQQQPVGHRRRAWEAWWNPQGNPWKSGVGISGIIRMIQGKMMLPNLGSCRYSGTVFFFVAIPIQGEGWKLTKFNLFFGPDPHPTQECLEHFLGKTREKGCTPNNSNNCDLGLWFLTNYGETLWWSIWAIHGNTKY